MSLQITSMADIFTIILVFLLKSFSTSLTSISQSGNMTLPVAQTDAKIKETLKLEISADAITVDDKPVVKLKNFEMGNGNDPEAQRAAADKLLKILSDQRKLTPDPNRDSNLIVMADERMPYSTLQSVLTSAASAGFVDLQLVVVTPN